ncbi:MAG: GNAT family N-acetyltransferase [Clostridium sp.]
MKEDRELYRRNGKNVYIKQPEFDELDYVSKLWADEETMRDIGGTFNFPEEKWKMFYKKMVQPTDGKNFYCLVYTTRDKAIGEVSFHGYDSATKIARFNIKIHHRYRKKGYGKEAIKLLLEYYFFDFGGEMIMDNITTEEGKIVADKLGFKGFRQFKNELTVRITKNDFLNSNVDRELNVVLLNYDGINFIDYSLPVSILNKANEIAGKTIFNIFTVGECEGSVSDTKINIVNNISFNDEKIKPNIMILPGGVDIVNQVKNKEVIRYILTHYNNCEYICGLSSSIKLLVRCRALDGVLVPDGKWIEEMESARDELRVLNRSFIDNGKLMLTGNMIGTIELCTTLINKVGGKTLSDKVCKELGL